jgi:phage terminase large subunit-like protein
LTVQRSAIICKSNNGVFRVLASDAPKQYGLNPSGVVIDELWAHPNEELYYALTTAQGAREEPLVVSITTAGFDPDSICGKLYERGKALEVSGVEAMRGERFLFRWFEAPPEASVLDEAGWEAANPSSWIGRDFLREQALRLPENVFRRLHLNQWTESEDAWLPPGAWDECFESGAAIPEGAPIMVGVDIGTMKDTSAVVKLWRRADGRIVAEAEIFKPSGHGRALELPKIEAALARAAERFDVKSVVYDPWTFERSAQDLSDRGMRMIAMPQTVERMAPISQDLYEAIVQREMVHNGDPVLAAHVRAGATKEHERGWRLVKGKSRNPIDALIAMGLALSQLKEPPGPPISDYRIESL